MQPIWSSSSPDDPPFRKGPIRIRRTDMDQLTLDILWSRLISTVNEQAAALMRSSFTSIVRDAGDLSAGRLRPARAHGGAGGDGHAGAYQLDGDRHGAPARAPSPGRQPRRGRRPRHQRPLADREPAQRHHRRHARSSARAACVAFFASCCHALDHRRARALGRQPLDLRGGAVRSRSSSCYEAGRPVQPILDIIAANSRARPRRCWATSTPRSSATRSARGS